MAEDRRRMLCRVICAQSLLPVECVPATEISALIAVILSLMPLLKGTVGYETCACVFVCTCACMCVWMCVCVESKRLNVGRPHSECRRQREKKRRKSATS